MTLRLLAAALAACGPKAYPAIVVYRQPEPAQIGAGTSFRVLTQWVASCDSSSGGWFPGLDRREETRRCNEQRFSIDVVCDGGCELVQLDGTVFARDRWQGKTVGEKGFAIRPTGTQLAVTITLRSGSRSEVKRIGPLSVIHARDFEVLCRTSTGDRPCDAGPVPANAALMVRATEGIELAELSINGRAQDPRSPSPLGVVLPDVSPGPHTLEIVINRGDHAVKKQITLEIAAP